MKNYLDLTPLEQEKAVNKTANRLLEGILIGAICFNDEKNGDNLQTRIDAAFEKAEAMQTTWYAHEYIMDTCKSELLSMALSDAQNALYAQPDEDVLYL